jgi:hypothetical protein
MAEARINAFKKTRRAIGVPSLGLVVSVLLFLPFKADAQDSDATPLVDEEIDAAFRTGLAGAPSHEEGATLEIQRYGPSVRLLGADADGLIKESLTCFVCTSDEILSAARSLGAAVRAEAAFETPAVLHIDEQVDGRLSVDEVPVAPPIGDHVIEPGDHTVTVAERETVRSGDLTVVAGTETALPPESDFRKAVDPSSRRRWAVVSSGIGLSLAAVGGVFLWLDGQCVHTDSRCDHEHNLLGPGIGLIATGALLQGVTLWLLVSSRKSKRR